MERLVDVECIIRFAGLTRVMGLSSIEDRMIVAGVVLTQCQRLTDGRTDRQTGGRTDGFTIANTALSIASYADAL